MSNSLKPLEEAVIGLLQEKPFFGYLLMSMKRNLNFKGEVAGVSVNAQGITLHIDLDMFNPLDLSVRKAILHHECDHIIRLHPTRLKQQSKQRDGDKDVHGEIVKDPEGNDVEINDAYIYNIAADCSINQYLPELENWKDEEGNPKGVMLENFRKVCKDPKISERKHAEYYYKFLKDHIKDAVSSGELKAHGDHSMWNDGEITEEQLKNQICRYAKLAKDRSGGKGLTSDELESIVELLESKINWKGQIKSFFANAEKTIVEETRKKRNRRYGVVYPGKKVEPILKIGVCVDTSGSISDNQLSQFFAEIHSISLQQNVEVVVIEADCEVKNVYVYDKKTKPTPTGRGGTAYQPAIDKATELECDAIVYAGDFDCADKPKKPRVPFLWVGVGNSPPPAEFGRVIRIP